MRELLQNTRNKQKKGNPKRSPQCRRFLRARESFGRESARKLKREEKMGASERERVIESKMAATTIRT